MSNVYLIRYESDAPYTGSELDEIKGAFSEFITDCDGDAKADSISFTQLTEGDIAAEAAERRKIAMDYLAEADLRAVVTIDNGGDEIDVQLVETSEGI